MFHVVILLSERFRQRTHLPNDAFILQLLFFFLVHILFVRLGISALQKVVAHPFFAIQAVVVVVIVIIGRRVVVLTLVVFQSIAHHFVIHPFVTICHLPSARL